MAEEAKVPLPAATTAMTDGITSAAALRSTASVFKAFLDADDDLAPSGGGSA